MYARAPGANYVKKYHMKILLMIIFAYQNKTEPSPGGFEPVFSSSLLFFSYQLLALTEINIVR